MENRISCSSGRASIIDPNNFGGLSSSNNIPVNNEDLNISVSLSTFKKGRTILTTDKEATANTFKTQGDVTVNFIDGENINGTKVLTTNYTNFSALNDEGNNDESLGITSIDIDFNSQQAPMITVNFIDVRGAAIFQNEANITEGKNKYATFFQLPYPLFRLTIKGYYGKPVEYCLHMYKFNSKFNSQTGNFEIQANFIGFTYAMLSDMLIGYLKAIPYTKIGKERYDIINTARQKSGIPNIMNLNELMIAIANINESISKLSANDADAIEITNIETKSTSLDGVMDIMLRLCSQLDVRGTTNERYLYIVKPSTYKVDVDKILSDFKAEINNKLTEFNTNSNITLDANLFTLSNVVKNTSVSTLNTEITETPDGKNPKDYSVVDYIHDNLSDKVTDTDIIDVWNLTGIFSAIDETQKLLAESTVTSKQKLGETIRLKIKEKLNLDPTIRNIIEIFTTAVEVFMETIYLVSASAEADIKQKRNPQLKNVFSENENHDLKNYTSQSNSILPWPGYRERKIVDNKETYIEKYLGAKNVLSKPMDVDEIAFIEDLLNAFLKAAEQTNLANTITSGAESTWFPINPVDTKLFGITQSPYNRIGQNGLTSFEQVAGLMVIRGITFLGYNNVYLTKDEIEQMAEIETNYMLSTIKDAKIKQALSNLTLTGLTASSSFTNIQGTINGEKRNILGLFNGNQYTYTYFPKGATNVDMKIIPINEGFEGTWVEDSNNVWSFSDSKTNNTIFLTNYNNDINNPSKNVDGGTYIKIFTLKDFSAPINLDVSLKPEKVDITANKLVLEKLKTEIKSSEAAKAAGFNAFGGAMGIQEFVNMDWGVSKYDKLPLSQIFFLGTSKKFGLAKRLKTDSTTIYDLDTYEYNANNTFVTKKNSGKTAYFDDSLTNSWDVTSGDVIKPVFTQLGENWNIIAEFDASTTSYPFVEAKYITLGNDYYYSLFGSRFYYGQSLSNYPIYSKALLFLSTLPWNGMPFENLEIKQLFGLRAGFIHVPKLWAAYVGGILWRQSNEEPKLSPKDSSVIIGGGSGSADPIIYRKSTLDVLPPCSKSGDADAANWVGPGRFQNLNNLFSNATDSTDIENLPSILRYLPNQIKDEFKKIFFNFVDGNSVTIGGSDTSFDFKTLNSLVQLVSDGKLNTFDTKLNLLYSHLTSHSSTKNYFYTDTVNITNNFINTDKYQWMIPLTHDSDIKKQINLMFKGVASDTKSPVGMIVGMMAEEVVIGNAGYQIWNTPVNSTHYYTSVYSSEPNFTIYFNKVIEILKLKASASSVAAETKQREQEIFGTSDVDGIKFQLYKTCKNIYDKWIGGVDNIDNIIFQCGGTKNTVDIALKDKYRPGDDKSRLIDSFRFVDRAFNDIGELFYMNPVPVNDYLLNGPNTSVFDAIGQLLSSNHFTFTPLPTFINYNDKETLASMFDTNPNYDKAIKDGVCGPSFVSVYAGDTSKHLDFKGSEYTNDGVDFVCGGPSGRDIINVPSDFIGTSNKFENDIAIFSVNYGQQNQNIFKDISLDQSEFSETDESLKISDDFAHKGTENNVSLGGQNIYNVYSVRSYKAEVEMLGNPMIQPMMHFQLNNIPMFHGAYMITRVKHSIKPNHMSTVFTGTRVRYPKTELLSGADFYMGIIDSMNVKGVGSNTSGTVGSSFGSASYPEQKPYVDYEILESDSIKYQVKKGKLLGSGDSWAMEEVGKFMEELARRWHTAKVKDPNASDVFRIRCFGAYGGGTNVKHGDTTLHAAGRAVDFRPMMTTKEDVTTVVGGTNYSTALNKELIQMALKLSDELKSSVTIQNIFLNDKTLISDFNTTNPGIMLFVPGHDNHIHIEFNLPSRVATAIKNKQPSGEAIQTNGTPGSVVKMASKMPNENDKLQSLGLIGK